MDRFELYLLLGLCAFLAIGELGVYLHSELVVYVALVVGIASLVPLWVDEWKKFTSSTKTK